MPNLALGQVGHALRRPVPGEHATTDVHRHDQVAGTFNNAGQVSLGTMHLLAQTHFLGNVFHEQKDVLDLVLPAERHQTVIVDPCRQPGAR